MTIETRGYADRRAGVRSYREHTVGATALRIDRLFDDDDGDVGGAARPTTRVRPVPRTMPRRPAAQRSPSPPGRSIAAVPRPRRERTPRATEVAPAAAQAPPLPLPKARFLLLLAGLLVVGVVGVLVLNTKINENSFRLGDLRDSKSELTVQEQALERELADLASPGNLRDAATRLGLVPAGAPAYIHLPDGRVVGVPQPASDVPATAQR